MSKAVSVIRINAGNDVNGNPRRAYVVLSPNAVIEAIDEGYEGEAALRASYPHLHVAITIDVTPKEYKRLLSYYPSKGMKRNPLSAHAAAIMGNESKRRIPGVKIVHNKLLGGWFIVRGPHHTPIGGRFDSKADAEAHLMRKNPKRIKVRRDMENRIAVQFHAHGVWATVKTFPNTVAGRKAAKAYATKAIKKIPHTFRAIAINQ